ncbi:MAG: hypothetical protein IAE81_17015 [Caldilineaceae bacterium]|nr:hypothetical protein [Caldilineaceae bacterium]
MTGKRVGKQLALLVVALLLSACSRLPLSLFTPTAAAGPAERRVTLIALAGPLADRDAEFSGLARLDDEFVLLPQYPARYDGNLFTVREADIVQVLAGVTTAPLTPAPLAFDDGGLATSIPGFEGFEALAISGDRVYLTIEAERDRAMQGYLVTGVIDRAARRISLDPASLVAIAPQAPLSNLSDEALTVLPNGDLLTFYEANGANVNPQPAAHRFDAAGAPAGGLPSPTIEYRITDATPADVDSRFWVINYFFPGDAAKLAPAEDALLAQGGAGATHAANRAVERLVEMQVDATGVTLVDQPPLQLSLLPGVARNWEGIARLQTEYLDGFLLVTDTFPATMLGFVEK